MTVNQMTWSQGSFNIDIKLNTRSIKHIPGFEPDTDTMILGYLRVIKS